MSSYEEVYQPPKAPLMVEAPQDVNAAAFYIVGKKKFLIMLIGTLGLYGLYWFYKHWAIQKTVTHEKIQPAARSIFNIFFTHSLAKRIAMTIQAKSIPYVWSAGKNATAYVLGSIVGNIADRISANGGRDAYWFDLLSLITMIISFTALYNIQKAANVACDDSEGLSNSQLTAANIAWLVLGGLLWALILFGLYEVYAA
jgi:hypothetical protein